MNVLSHNIFKKIYSLCLVLLPVLLSAQSLQIKFINTVGDTIMQPGFTYTNAFNETFNIRNFKYHISNITLRDEDGKLYSVSKEYFLVDEADSISKIIVLNHTVHGVKAIRFLLGVDSIRNISGVQTGTLDPAKGMFWTWNTGYIMAKLEGKSAASKSLGNYYTYHIGGYKKNENASRWIELPLQEQPGKTILTIKADAGKWFNGTQPVKIAEKPVCHEPGSLAMLIADNFAEMFSVWKQ